MKRPLVSLTLASIAILLQLAAPASCRSEQIYMTRISDLSLFDCCILDAQTYLAVGDVGKIYRTEDGGASWSEIPTPVRTPLFVVFPLDGSRVLAAGAAGVLLKSVDRGRQWEKAATGTERHIFNLAFGSPLRGVAVGDWGTILYTEDGGESWRAVSLEEDRMLYGVAYANSETVWVVGEAGFAARSDDGGRTWTSQTLPWEITLTAVAFKDARQGYMAGLDGLLAETIDGGQSWSRIQGIPPGAFYNLACAGPYTLVVGDYAAVLEKTGVSQWRNWALPPDLSVFWLNGVNLKMLEGNLLAICAGKKGLFLKQTIPNP